MQVYRFAYKSYRTDLSGTGAQLFGGRWNSRGNAVLYAASHISLAMLEILVNYQSGDSPIQASFYLLEIELPDHSIREIKTQDLKRNWKEDLPYSQFIGDSFLEEGSHLILKVPSVVVPEEYNLLINPGHKLFSRIKLLTSRPYSLDRRLH